MRLLTICLICFLPLAARAQATPSPVPAPSTFKLTDLQQANLRIAQLEISAAQKDFAAAVLHFKIACSNAVSENSWPAKTQCNMENLSIQPPPPDPKPETHDPAKPHLK